MIIAIDGLAATGKGTLAELVARRLDLPRMDTGLLYRAAGLACLDAGISPDDRDACAAIARRTAIDTFTHERLASAQAARAASDIGALEAVRQALFERQRAFATRPGGAVVDGRDIGTVIAPEADFKFWLRADIRIRAQRRWRQSTPDNRPDPDHVRAQLEARDALDTTRVHAPARPAGDAVIIDTTDMNQNAMLARAMEIIGASDSFQS